MVFLMRSRPDYNIKLWKNQVLNYLTYINRAVHRILQKEKYESEMNITQILLK